MERNITQKITRHPETRAGQDLRWLIDHIFAVNDRRGMDNWLLIFHSLCSIHRQFLGERTYYFDRSGRQRFHYTHERVRSAYRQIIDLLRKEQLFTYILYPELSIPRTTNSVEGGLNARLDELLYSHRGLSPEQERVIVDAYLESRSRL